MPSTQALSKMLLCLRECYFTILWHQLSNKSLLPVCRSVFAHLVLGAVKVNNCFSVSCAQRIEQSDSNSSTDSLGSLISIVFSLNHHLKDTVSFQQETWTYATIDVERPVYICCVHFYTIANPNNFGHICIFVNHQPEPLVH